MNRKPLFALIMSALFVIILIDKANADTHIATTCSQADVQAAIDTASDGDTVMLPAGTSTWTITTSQTPAVYINKKAITLMGSGNDQTYIYVNTGSAWMETAIWVEGIEGKPFRISGITFYSNNTGTIVCIRGNCTNFRIDYCKFDHMTGGRAIEVYGYGLIDHCTIVCPIDGRVQSITPNGFGSAEWSKEFALGSSKALYVEDCYFNNSYENDNCLDAHDGAPYVFRHNNARNVYPGNHGTETGGQRAAHFFEIYDNTFTADRSISGCLRFRDGTGVAFNNQYTGPFTPEILASNYRACGSYDPWGKCDGANPLDGNMAIESGSHTGSNGEVTLTCSGKNWTSNQWVNYVLWNLTAGSLGYVTENTATTITATLSGGSRAVWNTSDTFKLANGYPCLDQIGYTTSKEGTAFQPQRKEPMYEWNNTIDGSDLNIKVDNMCPEVALHIKENRDFFNNTEKPGYVPYIYPHPLTAISVSEILNDVTAPPATTGVRDGTGDDISFTNSTTTLSANWDAVTDVGSGVSGYLYAVGTVAGLGDVVSWTNIGLRTNIIRSDLHLNIGSTYYFSVKAEDWAGNQSSVVSSNGQNVVGGTGVSATLGEAWPTTFHLLQNYPNPFNPTTTISFILPSTSFVSLKIFDLLGREVAVLVSKELSAGRYAWRWNAEKMPSGIYFYRLLARPIFGEQTGSCTETKKIVLLR